MPPDGILGPPSPRSSKPLCSLDLIWTPRRSRPTHLAVLSRLSKPPMLGKSVLSQALSHWAKGEFDPLLGTSKRSSTVQGLPQKGERTTVITSV
jgi:hypothetical protein